MNYRIVWSYIGKILISISAFLLLPMVVALCYREYDMLLPFFYSILIMGGAGVCGILLKKKKEKFSAKEGLIIVGLSWILISVLGAFPYFLSGAIPDFIDCIFENTSGFTTTGASILADVESLPKSVLFYRSMSHWLGGMGVLVFVLAIMPTSSASAFHLIKFETTGWQVGKIVSKVRFTARILYAIYLAFTLLEVIVLLCGGIHIFDAICLAFSTAGTGGFAITNSSVASYNSAFVEIVITLFMFVFSLNFTLFYLALLKNFKEIYKNTELRCYLAFIIIAIFAVAINITDLYENFGVALRHSAFQVMSMISSTGFMSADYMNWPSFAIVVMMLCMFIGACAGSTGGGFKMSRCVLIVKSAFSSAKKVVSPYSVHVVKMDGKVQDDKVIQSVLVYFVLYMFVLFLSTLVVSCTGADFPVSLTSSLTCLNNTGPGYGAVGPSGNFGWMAGGAKIWLSFIMLAGRLELFPMLLLFTPYTWRRR